MQTNIEKAWNYLRTGFQNGAKIAAEAHKNKMQKLAKKNKGK